MDAPYTHRIHSITVMLQTCNNRHEHGGNNKISARPRHIGNNERPRNRRRASSGLEDAQQTALGDDTRPT